MENNIIDNKELIFNKANVRINLDCQITDCVHQNYCSLASNNENGLKPNISVSTDFDFDTLQASLFFVCKSMKKIEKCETKFVNEDILMQR